MKHQATITILSLVFNVAMGIFLLITGKPFSAAPHFLQGYREYQSLEQPPLSYGSDGVAQVTHDQCGGSLVLDLSHDVVYCSKCKAVIRLLKSSRIASTKSTQSSPQNAPPNKDLVSVVEAKSPSYQNSKMRTVQDFSDPFAPIRDNSPKDNTKKEKWTPTQSDPLQEIRDRLAEGSRRDGMKRDALQTTRAGSLTNVTEDEGFTDRQKEILAQIRESVAKRNKTASIACLEGRGCNKKHY